MNYLAGSPLQVTRGRPGKLLALSGIRVAGAAMLMLAADVAWPQGPPPPSPVMQAPIQPVAPDPASPQSGALPSSPPAARQENPGLIKEIGKFFEKSWSSLPSIKSPSETIDDLHARAKDAGDALSRMARPPSMVTGRARCPVSANGAPDCKTASDTLCRGRGFKEGKSLSSDSSQTCSAKILIPGRNRKPDDCRIDHYVTLALCQ